MEGEARIQDGELEVQNDGEADADPKTLDEDLHVKIGQLEERIVAKDGELSAAKDALSVAVARYRVAVLASAPGIPEELVKGDTVEEIDASLALAGSIVSRIRQQLDAEAAARGVPAGAPPRTSPDLSALSPEEKIAYALSNQQT